MSTSAAPTTSTLSPTSAHPQHGGPGLLRTVLVANLWLQGLIILTGGLVRLTGSGLGCSEWPRCTPDSFTPVAHQAQGYHSLIEFGNRLLTFVLAGVAIALVAVVLRHRAERPDLVKPAFVPILGIVAQAVVGGVIVLSKLDPKTVSPHFLLSVLLVAFSAWLLVRYDEGPGPRAVTVHPVLLTMTRVAAAAAAVVVVLGTAVTGSGPHSGDADEPVRFGFDPQTTAWIHADAVMLLVGCVVALVVGARITDAPARFGRWWLLVLALCVAQGVVGYTQYFTGLPILLVMIHLAGSALLTAWLTFAVLAARRP